MIGFVAGGIRGGISTPDPLLDGDVCDFQLFAVAGRASSFSHRRRPIRASPTLPFPLIRPPRARPAAVRPSVRPTVSQIAVVDDCSKLFSPLHCLSRPLSRSRPLSLSRSLALSPSLHFYVCNLP